MRHDDDWILIEEAANPGGRARPALMTVAEVADLLRTSDRAIYAMVARAQLPGVVRIGRRVLFDEAALLRWLDEKRAVSSES